MKTKLNLKGNHIPGTPEQWREIAKAFSKLPSKRTDREDAVASNGLCFAIDKVARFNHFSSSLSKEVFGTAGYIAPTRNFCGCDWTRACDLERARIARVFAKEIERRRKISGG